MSLKVKLADPFSIPLIFEVVPPDIGISPSEFKKYLNQISKLTKTLKIDAVDIPELIQEKTIKRKAPLKRISPRDLAKSLYQETKIPVIINRVTVFRNLQEHRKWLLNLWKRDKIKNLIFVGAPDDRLYPGLSVSQAAKLVKKFNQRGLTDFNCGGITIPSRRKEVERMIKKQESGINFFLSQIIYEPEQVKKLLEKYYLSCLRKKISPKRVFLTFSPVSSSKDLDFLKSLQVNIPEKTEKLILKNKEAIKENSIKLNIQLFKTIASFCHQKKIKVPLGIAVAYVRTANFGAARKLTKQFTAALLKRP